jgi:hypothetical protein
MSSYKEGSVVFLNLLSYFNNGKRHVASLLSLLVILYSELQTTKAYFTFCRAL